MPYLKRDVWYLSVIDANGKQRRLRSTAQTKREACRLEDEHRLRYEREREQRRHGITVGVVESPDTLGSLLLWWLDTHSAGLPSHDRNVARVRKHFGDADIAKHGASRVTTAMVETFLHFKARSGLSPQSVNHLRSLILWAYNEARRMGRYAGANPVADVRRRRVTKRKPDYLRTHEVPRVLEALAADMRPLFATAIYTGLRKGELLALQKRDVDLQQRTITVQRSHARDITKGGRVDVIPIATELVPYLSHAIDASPSKLVFPNPDGSMRRGDYDLPNILRTALKRAGIVEEYEHRCRRKGCGTIELHADDTLRTCGTCNMKLWPVAQVRPIRFHDLRHTTASLLMMAGANPASVQRIMRHSDPRITTEVYGHLSPEYLRAEIDRLRFNVAAPERVQKLPLAATGSLPREQSAEHAFSTAALLADSQREKLARDEGVEPTTFGFGDLPKPVNKEESDSDDPKKE